MTYDPARCLAAGAMRAHGLLKETIYGGLNQTLPELLDFEAEWQAVEMAMLDHQEWGRRVLGEAEANFAR
jgi:hypothetical protein